MSQRLPLRLALRFVTVTVMLTLSIRVCGQNVAELYLISSANQERIALGLPILRFDRTLADVARLRVQWVMLGQRNPGDVSLGNELLLRLNEERSGFDVASEIIVSATAVGEIQVELMLSGEDRAKLLDPAYDVVGVSVTKSAGRLLAVEELGHRASTPQTFSYALPSGGGGSPRDSNRREVFIMETSAEEYLFKAASRERARYGLAGLNLDKGLVKAAYSHAREMASRQQISHQFSGEKELSARGASAGVRFTRISENVAEASTAAIMHDAWMRSPGHRENLLDPKVDSVGIAAVFRDGQFYAVEDFAHITPDLTIEQQEASVGKLLDDRGLELEPESAEVQRVCSTDSGYVGLETPAFVMRYTTDDLNTLPERLKDVLREGRYRRAAVGACLGGLSGAFTSYRVAVLLFQ